MTSETESAPEGAEGEVVPEIAPWETEEAVTVREERNARLAATDILMLQDHPAQRSMETRAAVWLYRRALRDVTKAFASPADVVWPAEPEV